jgi:hypothetical protein
MSYFERLRQARAELSERGSDPWRRALERDLPANVTSISTVALLDLLDVPPTTGNARRLALSMRSMGWVPLKSRRLMPGGFRDTTIRGWARPLREQRSPTTLAKPDHAPVAHHARPRTPGSPATGRLPNEF